MSTVRISRKSALAIFARFANTECDPTPGWAPMRELSAALQRKTPKASAKLTRQKKAAKRQTKSAQTKAIREFIFDRAGDQCEALEALPTGIVRCPAPATDMHHAFGRRIRQQAANCLAICRPHHRRYTDNVPSRVLVLEEQARTFDEMGYVLTARALRNSAEFERTAEQLSESLGRHPAIGPAPWTAGRGTPDSSGGRQ